MAEARVNRRLAAILCADVAEYSRLMGADEEGTLAALKGHRRELIDPLLTQHQGRIVAQAGRREEAKAAAARALALQPGLSTHGLCAALSVPASLAAPLSAALHAAGLPD